MTTIFGKVNDAKKTWPIDVDGLANSLGVKVQYVPMSDEISGALVEEEGGVYVIILNANHPRTRQRFTLAHELGHFIHHRPLVGEGVNDSKAYRTTAKARHFNPRVQPKHETEANQFAVSLLMPTGIVSRMRSSGLGAKEVAEKLEVSLGAAAIRIDTL